MRLIEKKMDLFKVDEKYYLAHCISSDFAMGAGIAVEFQKRFKLRQKLREMFGHKTNYPNCSFVNPVFNLITKEKYWHKPTYTTLRKSLEIMKSMIVELNNTGEKINYIAMPKIGCGLDRLQWGKVKELIEEIFNDLDIEILVCYL